MKTGLSKREKILIFIAVAALLIILTVQYVLTPMYQLHGLKTDEYGTLTTEKMFMEMKLQSEETTRANHERAEEAYYEIERKYPSTMPNEVIDHELTDLCLRNNLDPKGLEISKAVSFYAIKEDEEKSAEKVEDQKPPAFYTIDAKMSLSGDYQSLKRLIDAVEKIDHIRIRYVSFVYESIITNENSSNLLVYFEFTVRNEEV